MRAECFFSALAFIRLSDERQGRIPSIWDCSPGQLGGKSKKQRRALLTRYDPEDSLIDACNLGTAGQQFFEAYDQAKRMGLDKKNWLDAAFEICEFAMSRQRLDGGIGMSWNRDGSPHELKGTAGVFLILPLAEAFLRTGEDRYSIAAVRAYSYYYREFANNGYEQAGRWIPAVSIKSR